MPEPLNEIRKLVSLLEKIKFFEKLKVKELEELAKHIKKETALKGKVLIKQGDIGDAFYMVAEGKVSVWFDKPDEKVLLSYLGPGEFFGEMALVTQNPRSATVVAEEFCRFYVLYSYDFKELIMKNPKISFVIETALRKRRLGTMQKRGLIDFFKNQ
jgi:CRP-like cAMP-binding protein